MRERAVVSGLWGCSGDRSEGIGELCDLLRGRLQPLAVPAGNVFAMSWSPGHNSEPWAAPDTDEHARQLTSRTAQPTYVAIIGHSYGGWAASLPSRRLADAGRPADYVAIIDPVFGPPPAMAG